MIIKRTCCHATSCAMWWISAFLILWDSKISAHIWWQYLRGTAGPQAGREKWSPLCKANSSLKGLSTSHYNWQIDVITSNRQRVARSVNVTDILIKFDPKLYKWSPSFCSWSNLLWRATVNSHSRISALLGLPKTQMHAENLFTGWVSQKVLWEIQLTQWAIKLDTSYGSDHMLQ